MIAPGYYWIRWPAHQNRHLREWTVGRVHQGAAVDIVGSAWTASLTGAELGPRIEPPGER